MSLDNIIKKFIEKEALSELEVENFIDNIPLSENSYIEEDGESSLLFIFEIPFLQYHYDSGLIFLDERFFGYNNMESVINKIRPTGLMSPKSIDIMFIPSTGEVIYEDKFALLVSDVEITNLEQENIQALIQGGFSEGISGVAKRSHDCQYLAQIIVPEENSVFSSSKLLTSKRSFDSYLTKAALLSVMVGVFSTSAIAQGEEGGEKIKYSDLAIESRGLIDMRVGRNHGSLSVEDDLPLSPIEQNNSLGGERKTKWRGEFIYNQIEHNLSTHQEAISSGKFSEKDFGKVSLKSAEDLIKSSKMYSNLKKMESHLSVISTQTSEKVSTLINGALSVEESQKEEEFLNKIDNKQKQLKDKSPLFSVESQVKTLKGRAKVNFSAMNLVEGEAEFRAFSGTKIKANVKTKSRDIAGAKVHGAISYEDGIVTQGAYIGVGGNLQFYGERKDIGDGEYGEKEIRTGVGFKWDF